MPNILHQEPEVSLVKDNTMEQNVNHGATEPPLPGTTVSMLPCDADTLGAEISIEQLDDLLVAKEPSIMASSSGPTEHLEAQSSTCPPAPLVMEPPTMASSSGPTEQQEGHSFTCPAALALSVVEMSLEPKRLLLFKQCYDNKMSPNDKIYDT